LTIEKLRFMFLSALCSCRYGFVVDNTDVGKDLAEVYWKPGNRAQFLDLVQTLTGAPLTASAWVEQLNTPSEEVVRTERVAYNQALQAGPAIRSGSEVDLDMRVLLVHGDEVIADSQTSGLHQACEEYKKWLATLN
jgi:hypothetical protein